MENGPALWRERFPVLNKTGHKYDRGHAVVLSGPVSATGAARLAAHSALRIGSGLVTLLSPGSAMLVNAAHLTAVMLRRVDGPAELEKLLADTRITAVVLGPGLGVSVETVAWVEAALTSGRNVVLDADALTSFAQQPASLFELIRRCAGSVVLTPHMGEFQRLFGADGTRDEMALKAAQRSGAVVVLKGAHTMVAAGNGQVVANRDAPPWLATAGSGDVLAGAIGGLLGQGMPAFEAACAGVWLHGQAGQAAGPGMIAEDLDEGLRTVLRDFLRRHRLIEQ